MKLLRDILKVMIAVPLIGLLIIVGALVVVVSWITESSEFD